MEISKHIEIGPYRFEITLESKSTEAHSLMTDYKEGLDIHMGLVRQDTHHVLDNMGASHQEKHKG